MAAIETKSLTRRFGDVTAVRDVDLTVEEGEVYGFFGPDGGGKATVIGVLLDFIRPSSGTATVLGYDAHADAETVRGVVGTLPDTEHLYGRLTGREHLEFAIDAEDADDDPSALLDRVGMSQVDADRTVGEYSNGLTQRLALGMALIGGPKLLVLDEHSSGIDLHGIGRLREPIQREANGGTTVLLSSRHLLDVSVVCDRLGTMNDGELVVRPSVVKSDEKPLEALLTSDTADEDHETVRPRIELTA